MERKLWLLALVGALLLSSSSVLADGDFYLVAAGGGVGTKITNVPFPITQSGFYYLTGNLSCPSGNGITVTANDVTIDLMGFTLSGTTGGTGVLLNGSRSVEVRNGTFKGWGTVISSLGTDSGHRVLNVRVDSNSIGIYLSGLGHLVKGCTAVNNASQGIFVEGGTISGNVASQNGTGIQSNWGSVIGNSVWCNANQIGIELSTNTQYAVVMDQNSVCGPGTRYKGGSSSTVWAGSSNPTAWGNNAGHP
jgi:parallel beta-helix repeat protein